jgi:DNA-binding beta-propeller fold protein YncE
MALTLRATASFRAALLRIVVFAGSTILSPGVAAHAAAERAPATQPSTARLLVADAATGEIVVVSLADGATIARLPTPPFVLSLGLANDGQHIFAIRGHDTDRDTVTIIDSGLDRRGQARFPTVLRTIVWRTPGGISGGRVAAVGGRTAIFSGGDAAIDILGSAEFGSLDAVPVRRIALLAPDHYQYIEVGNFLYVTYLRGGLVQVIDGTTGVEVGRVGSCPQPHGMALDAESGRVFIGCQDGVLVIATRGSRRHHEVARISYPASQRIGFFLRGPDRIWWGRTEGVLPRLQRLDAATEPYVLQAVPVEDAIRTNTTADGKFLLAYSRTGWLCIHDGRDGSRKHRLRVSGPYTGGAFESMAKATLPDLAVFGDYAYLSLPHEGTVVEVAVTTGKVLRRIAVGGEPTRMVVVGEPGA